MTRLDSVESLVRDGYIDHDDGYVWWVVTMSVYTVHFALSDSGTLWLTRDATREQLVDEPAPYRREPHA